MSGSNCCYLTCIQVSLEAGQVVWYSHLSEFSTVCCDPHKGFGVINEAEVDVFLELSCLFYDPALSRFVIAFAPLVLLQIKSLLGFCRMPRAGKWGHPATDPSISVWVSSLTSHWGNPLILGSSSVWLNIPELTDNASIWYGTLLFGMSPNLLLWGNLEILVYYLLV